ncbi:MAG: enoyl-CoA hydratase-related protein [Porticoccaceae bacterium]
MTSWQGDWSHTIIEESIATVTLGRGTRRNALPPAAHHELARVFDDLAQTPGLRAIIVTGADSAFCAGYDLKDSCDDGEIDVGPSGFAGLTLRSYYPLPIIAAVNGIAFGGGFETALACDLIIAADSARFALPEAKVGLAALGGGIQRLSRTIGLQRALGIILTGRTVDAREAQALGFVSQVVPDDELMSTARAWARDIAACAPLAISCSRQVAYRSVELARLADSLDLSNYPLAKQLLESEDAVEGRRAFAEKRAPRWQGK